MANITCARCGKSAEPLASAPMGGALGATIQERVCSECWREWINQQMLVINHYQLQMADPDDRKRLTAEMKEFLGIDGSGR